MTLTETLAAHEAALKALHSHPDYYGPIPWGRLRCSSCGRSDDLIVNPLTSVLVDDDGACATAYVEDGDVAPYIESFCTCGACGHEAAAYYFDKQNQEDKT